MESPQQLSREATAEFKEIYDQEFGTDISDVALQESATALLRLFRILAEPSGSDSDHKTGGQPSYH